MKKLTLTLFCLVFCVTSSFAQFGDNNSNNQASSEPATGSSWDVIQVGFLIGVPPSTNYTDSYLAKLGIPISGGNATAYVLEASALCSATDNVKGLQASLGTSISEDVDGVQISLVNYVEKMAGMQLGIFNYSEGEGQTFQMGIVNYIKGNPLPVLPFVNLNL